MLISKTTLNHFFYHISCQLILHLIFSISFGTILSSDIPHETYDDAFIYLCASISLIYNLIACGISVLGLAVIEIFLKKQTSDPKTIKALIFLRIYIIINQIFSFFTCVAMAISFSKRGKCSKEIKPLLDLSIAYTIIGFVFILSGSLFLSSAPCILKCLEDKTQTPGDTVI